MAAGIVTAGTRLRGAWFGRLALPVTTRRNVSCSHLCAHGAAQQLLLVRFARPRRGVTERLRPWLAILPWALLATCILVACLAAAVISHWRHP